MEEQYVVYSLWTRNRAGEPVGVYSHETALSIHELSDANPAKLQLTVPPDFRRTAPVPKVLVLHRARLAANDIEQRQGFALTRPIRTVADMAEQGNREFTEQALRDGRNRGVITKRQILNLRRKGGHPEWFDRLLEDYSS